MNDATISFINNIAFWGQDGGGLYADDSDSVSGSDIYYNDIIDNAGGEYVGYFTDETGASGNISTDPLIRDYSADGDETNDDLRLTTGSPCIDTGHPSYLDVDGSRSDMGAFGGESASVTDADGDGAYSSVDCDDDDADVYPGATEIA